MRIVHVTPSLAQSHGGVSAAVRGLAEAQRRTGDNVAIYTGFGPDDAGEGTPVFDEPIARDGLEVRQFPISRGRGEESKAARPSPRRWRAT